MKRGSLAVISGFSGVGKGTIVAHLMNCYDDYALSISATTRKPRNGEVNGREYFFLSKEDFEERIRNHGFLEYTCYVGNYYGTPRDYVEQKLNEGKNVILEIEMEGGLHVKQAFPETKLIFIVPPDDATLRTRLQGRGTESEEQILARLERALEERSFIDRYDYVVVNDNLEEAVKRVDTIIRGTEKEA